MVSIPKNAVPAQVKLALAISPAISDEVHSPDAAPALTNKLAFELLLFSLMMPLAPEFGSAAGFVARTVPPCTSVPPL